MFQAPGFKHRVDQISRGQAPMAVSGAAATVEVWMHCEVPWKRRGGTSACQCLGFFRVSLRPAVAVASHAIARCKWFAQTGVWARLAPY